MQHSSCMTALPYLPRCAALHQRPFATWFSHVNIGYPSQLILGVWLICTIRPPHDFRSLLQPGSGVGSVMGLDVGRVLKRSVACSQCSEDHLFTLRAIASNTELRCHGCGGS